MKTLHFCIGKIAAVFFLVVLVSSFLAKREAIAEMDSPLVISDPAELARVKKAVLTWSNSLKSFKGSYSLRQQNYGHPNGNVTPVAAFGMEAEYRFQGKNRYLSVEIHHPDGKITRQHGAEMDGSIQRRDDMKVGSETEYGVVYPDNNQWPFPDGAFLLPTEVFGESSEKSLEERLEEGTLYLLDRDGVRVLSQVCFGEALEIYLDEDERVRRIDTIFRPAISMEELRTVWGEEEPLNVFWCVESLELDAYQEIDGVDFPVLAKRTTYMHDHDRAEKECFQPFNAKVISVYELHMCQMKLPTYPTFVADFQLHIDTVSINKRLWARSFKLPMDDGDRVYGGIGKELSYVYETPWYARPITWGIAVAVLLLLGGGGIFWYVQRPA